VEAVEIALAGLTLRYQPGFGAVPDRFTYAAEGCGTVQALRFAAGYAFGEVEGSELRCTWRALRACCRKPATLRLYQASGQSYAMQSFDGQLCVERH